MSGCPKVCPWMQLQNTYCWHGRCCSETGTPPCLAEGIPPQLNCESPDGKEAEEQGVGSLASCSCLSLFISEKPISNLPWVIKEINLILSTFLRVDTRPPLEHLLLVDPGRGNHPLEMILVSGRAKIIYLKPKKQLPRILWAIIFAVKFQKWFSKLR